MSDKVIYLGKKQATGLDTILSTIPGAVGATYDHSEPTKKGGVEITTYTCLFLPDGLNGTVATAVKKAGYKVADPYDTPQDVIDAFAHLTNVVSGTRHDG